MPRLVFVGIGLALLVGCTGSEPDVELTELPADVPAAAHLTRLTAEQYRNSIKDVLGDDLALPAQLEPDPPAGGLIAVGASETTISAWGVEQYESGAFSIAAQVMDDESRRASIVPCAPQGTTDDACARDFVTQVGLRLWRRPLVTDEVDALVRIANDAATTLDDFYDGLEFALAALLQAPSFLFRVELGQDGVYTDYEMASRLSFFLWNTTPDETLLAAAAAKELTTREGLEKHARRMLDDPRARKGLRRFFTDMFHLYELDTLTKDPTLFVHFSTDVGGYAREETLSLIEHIVFDQDSDYRELFTADYTFANRHLAAIYGVRATATEGFSRVALPQGERRGLLGQVSFLALESHPAASSAVLRGYFVRTVLLCQTVPPPPVDANTGLPEPSETARTLRERNVVHLENPACSGCHSFMDPIGLGLENFDGLGRWREKDNGGVIDPTGDLDGEPFANAWELAGLIANNDKLGRCLSRTMYRYATAHVEEEPEDATIDALSERFAQQGFRVKALVMDVIMSPGFSQTKGVTP